METLVSAIFRQKSIIFIYVFGIFGIFSEVDWAGMVAWAAQPSSLLARKISKMPNIYI